MGLNLIDYKLSQHLSQMDIPFDALIAAAMRKADSTNLEDLKRSWPTTYKDLQKRYNAGGGRLDGEENADEDRLDAIVNSYIGDKK